MTASDYTRILAQRKVLTDALSAAGDELDRLETAAEAAGCDPEDMPSYTEVDDRHTALLDSLWRFDVEAIAIAPDITEHVAAWREYHCGQDIAELLAVA